MPTSKRKNQKTRPAAPSVDPRNRLNDLDSRSWLKFQKSWYVLPTASSGATAPAAEFVIFFTKKRNLEGHRSRVGLIADNAAQLSPVIKKLGREAVISNSAAAHGTLPLLDYALLDLRGAQLEPTRDRLLAPPWQHGLEQLARHLKPGAYMTIFASNSDADGRLLPWAWLIALAVGELLFSKMKK